MKQKIMQVMKERDDSKPLTCIVQIDDAYYGGERGRGSENITPFVAAVSTNEEGHPIHMNFTVVKGFRLSEISQLSKKHLSSESTVVSDALACFKAFEDTQCQHFSIVTGGGSDSAKKSNLFGLIQG